MTLFPQKKTHFDASKISSRMLIQQLIFIGREYVQKVKNVTAIIYIILTPCVKMSVESVVETLVSMYEHNFRPSRQLDEDSAAYYLLERAMKLLG